jgi:hypothetical protein
MDDLSYDIIRRLDLQDVIPIQIEELPKPEINVAKAQMSHGQFCWTCQPIVCEFILNRFNVDMITYLEADSMFFADPEILFEELGDQSVSIVPHHYSPGYDQTSISGVYCVQFNAFRNDSSAREVLHYWKSKCFEYSKDALLFYPGQLCINEWPSLFKSVKVIDNPGAGVAVWNIQHRTLSIRNNIPFVDETPIVFYHYHQFRFYSNEFLDLSLYPLAKSAFNTVYISYIKNILKAKALVQSIDAEFHVKMNLRKLITTNVLLSSLRMDDFLQFLRLFKRRIKKIHNIYREDFFHV